MLIITSGSGRSQRLVYASLYMFTTGPCRVSVVKLKIRTIAGPDGSVVDRLAIVVPNGIGHPGGKFKVGHFEPAATGPNVHKRTPPRNLERTSRRVGTILTGRIVRTKASVRHFAAIGGTFIPAFDLRVVYLWPCI